MKPHLPVLLRKVLLVFSFFTFACSGAVYAADYTLGGDDLLSIDYAVADSILDLEDGTLQLNGDTHLQLVNCGNGDGKTYTLATGISSLLDTEGNAIALDFSNNAISSYFDDTQPGTGFWAGSTLQLDDNGTLQLVRHNEVVKAAASVTSRQTNGADYQYYEGIAFSHIAYQSTSHDWGGAICGGYGAIALSNNGSVLFEGNSNTASSSSARGGAIYGVYSIALSNNGSVVFVGNAASSGDGGAICGDEDIILCDNGSVQLSGNKARFGGAILGGPSVKLSGNGSVVFSSNSAREGGAIYGKYSDSVVALSYNGRVKFSANTASSCGGAVYGDGDIVLGNNDSVMFLENTAGSSGGAIYGWDSIMLSNNNSVEFSGNTVSEFGGAIYGHDSITLSNNGNVTFRGNSANGFRDFSSDSSNGGAIHGDGDITLSNNGSVTFCGNTVSASSSSSGGAIYGRGNLSICNNDSVEFYQNVETVNDSYRLRSIYVKGSGYTVSLSAAGGKSIEFRDSVYIASSNAMKLNEDYTYQNADGESVTIKQRGDIVFSGATTVDDLYIVKGNVAGSDEDILASRTTEVNTMTELYGGRLRVEDGAIYQGQGILVHEGSEATVLVKDATLNHEGYALTFNAGTSLQVEGESLIVGDVLMMAQSVLNLEGETTINGALTLGLGMQLAGNILAEVQNLQVGESLTLVSGLESLAVQTQNLMRSVEYTTVMDGYEVQASEYFANLAGNTGLVMRYDGEADTVSITQTMSVPEPTTATLSLLALAALAMRRRRK